MSETAGSIWDDESWDVECPPSIPLNLWEMVPEEYRREFIIEAAFALRRGIHPIDTFEEMLEEKGIQKQVVEAPATPNFDDDEPVRPTGRMSFGKAKPTATAPMEKPNENPYSRQNGNAMPQQNSAAAKLWPGKPAINSLASRPTNTTSGTNLGLGRPSTNSIKQPASRQNNFDRPAPTGLALKKKQQIIVDDIGDTF